VAYVDSRFLEWNATILAKLMQITEIFLIRHGETAWNHARRIQGQLDVPLSPYGLRQAQALLKYFKPIPCHAVYSSDLQRALTTAAPLAKLFGVALETRRSLRERHFGVLQGRLRDDIAHRDPRLWDNYRNNIDYTLPLGESAAGFATRCEAALRELAIAHVGQRIVVVSHGGVIASLFKHSLGLPQNNQRPFALKNASVNVFHFHSERWWLDTWGDVSHLRALDIEANSASGAD
jgi:probable phosphoglycerate mutase